jgi:hypothetical protein
MSPKSNAVAVIRPGTSSTAAAFMNRSGGDRLESLAAIWARQTGRSIRVVAPR